MSPHKFQAGETLKSRQNSPLKSLPNLNKVDEKRNKYSDVVDKHSRHFRESVMQAAEFELESNGSKERLKRAINKGIKRVERVLEKERAKPKKFDDLKITMERDGSKERLEKIKKQFFNDKKMYVDSISKTGANYI